MIIDKMRPEYIGGVRIPKLKGHVKIRLHNPTTGKTEIHEGDNMITNAVSDIFAANLCGVMKYQDMLPLYSKMFGGVILFNGKLDESDADDYFIPDNSTYAGDEHPEQGGNTVIAHAGQTTFSDQSDDVTRGNPLATSMTVADGAVTLAWEWGSTAGVGTIKSLGLTHTDVGDAGTGSNSAAFTAMTPIINANYGLVPPKPVFFIDEDGYGYDMSISGTTLTLTKFPVVYSEAGLVGIPFDYVSGIEKTKNVTLQTSFNGSPMYFFDKESSKLYLFYNASLSNSVVVDIINLSNFDSIPSPTHAVWNNLDESVGPLVTTPSRFCNLPFNDGYVYLPKFTAIAQDTIGFLKIKLSSTGDQTFVTNTRNGKMLSGVFQPNESHRIIVGKSFVINNDVLYKTAIATPDWVYTWAGDNTTVNSNLDQGKSLVGLTFTNNKERYYPSISKFYLATKYNLPAAITKSNMQNMVVTYTLTEVTS